MLWRALPVIATAGTAARRQPAGSASRLGLTAASLTLLTGGGDAAEVLFGGACALRQFHPGAHRLPLP